MARLKSNGIAKAESVEPLKNVKDNGYSLYITNENKLGIIFYEVTDEEEYRREYVLN